MHSLVIDIGISLLSAAIVGFILHLLKQPLILGYIIAGAIIGPEIGLGLVYETDSIQTISEIGLILLLFIIGLELNPNKLRSMGKELLFAGIGQFVVCVLLGIGFFLLIGYGFNSDNIDALYLSLFCALSSTAIVVKLLYDKFELDSIPGRITLGILIFQDVWAILILAVQPNFNNPQLQLVGLAVGKSILLLIFGFLASKYFLKKIFEIISKTSEMILAVSIAWCAFMTGLSSYFGLSMEMGSLIAGTAISTFPYGIHIIAKVLPLRDFFLTLFFLSIGMMIPVPNMAIISSALVIIVFVFISRFASVYPILALTGRGRRTRFITSLNLSQISEFSLVIAALGVGYGHISGYLLTVITYAMAITSVLSSYFVKGNHEIYLFIDKLLGKFGFRSLSIEESVHRSEEHYPIILLGCHRGGLAFIDKINRTSPELLNKLLVIDYNLEVLKELDARHIHGMFGDISSMDTLAHANLDKAEIIFSTVPDMLLKGTNNKEVVHICRTLAPEAKIIATADSTNQIEELIKAGADKVILPYSLIGDQLAAFAKESIAGRIK